MARKRSKVHRPPVPPLVERRRRLSAPLLSLIALLAVVGGWAWSTSFGGVFVLDDLRAIVQNPTIRTLWPLSVPLSPPGASTVAGRPIANLSFAVSYALGDPDLRSLWSFHALNLLIHFAAALVLFGIVSRMLSSPPLRDRYGAVAPYLALITALLWAVHPLQTESVTYVVQRVESLMGLFYLLTLYCALRALEDTRVAWWTAGGIIAAVLGMATKEVMVTVPIAIALWYRVFGSSADGRARARVLAGVAASWFVFLILVLHEHRTPSLDLQPLTAWRYLLTQTGVILHYLRLSFWPSPLVFLYTWPLGTSLWSAAGPAIVVATLLALTLVGVVRRHPLAYAGAWFFLVLAPTSSVIPIATEVAAEHRMYLPLAAVIACAVVAVHDIGKKLLLARPGAVRIAIAVLISTAAVVSLAAQTRARNRDYWSDEALWRDTVEKQPDNQRARVAYGSALGAAGRLSDAEGQFRRAIELNDADPLAHARLGTVLAAQNKPTEAIGQLERALVLRPDDIDAHRVLGQIYASRRDDARAVVHLGRAVELAGDNPPLLTNLAAILADSRDASVRDVPRALALAERAVALTGRQDAFALDVLSVAQAGMGRYGEAAATAREGAALARAQDNQALVNEMEYRASAYGSLAR